MVSRIGGRTVALVLARRSEYCLERLAVCVLSKPTTAMARQLASSEYWRRDAVRDPGV
jgi:hypothetical protein